jgi:hypothetical protein
MRFYRGIAVPAARASSVIADIQTRGLLPGDGRWRMIFNDLKPKIAELWERPALGTDDTKYEAEKPSWVCACGDETGAIYYATRHNGTEQNNTPLLITFEADLRNVIIDGRDFLYTVFQFGDPERARSIIKNVYGGKILRYLDRAWATTDQSERIALYDLATQDDAVISAHHRNKVMIGGRFKTQFRTAFMVQTPVRAERIIAVTPLDRYQSLPEPEITLQMVLIERYRGATP